MELAKYDLQPQEQLAVSLYLKSMNKTQAARDAGYGSPSVFNKPSVKGVVAEQLSIRAERLRVGGDWVLMELKRVYDRCMQTEKVLDRDGNPTGELHFDATNAIKALTQIGKHVDVRAFDVKDATSTINDDLVARLHRGRQRMMIKPNPPTTENPPNTEELLEETEADIEDESPVSFLRPPTPSPEHVTDISDPDILLSDEDELERLMRHWRTKSSDRHTLDHE